MSDATSGIEIAVIGMAGRFPGARNLDQFWQNLCDGVESIRFFTDEELLAKGVEARLLDDPNYVKAEAILDDIEMFDASFFDFTPREASLIDPQHRLFLEHAWEALENAGYARQRSRHLQSLPRMFEEEAMLRINQRRFSRSEVEE